MPVGSVEGYVKAVSLVYRTSPRKFFIEVLCDSNTVVIVAQEEQECWQNVLRVNSAFCFSNLVLKDCNFKGRQQSHSLSVWCATPDSKCTCVLAACFAPQPLQTCSPRHKVTGVFRPLALYEIDDSLHLSLTFMLLHANVPDLQLGQDVVVLDAHLVRDCLFICGRSLVIVKDQPYSDQPIAKDSLPLVSLITKYNFSIEDVFWLKMQHKILERKFSDHFLQEMGVLPELCPGLRENILSMAVKYVSPPTVMRSVLEEFLDHTQCDLDHLATFSKSFLTLHDIVHDWSEVDSSVFWSHGSVEYTQESTEMPLVAYLDTVDGQWMLRDSTHALPCIITSLDHPSALLPLIGNFVALTKFQLIRENFQAKTGTVKYIYVVVPAKDLQLVFNMQKKLAKHLSKCPYCSRAYNASHVCLRYDVLLEKNHDAVLDTSRWDELPRKKVCDDISSTSCRSKNSSVCIRILHKSAVRVLPDKKGPLAYILGLLLGEDTTQEGSCSKLCFFELNSNLLMVLPLLDTDAVYKLRFPENFKLSTKLPPGFLYSVIKTSNVIVLPEESSFYHIKFSQKCKNFYSVSESLQEGQPRDLLDVEAIITGRTHIDPKFSSEKVTVMETGFGVPSSRTVLLRLKDVNGGPEMNAYLKCGRCRYPVGLLPGNCVRLTMMEKRVTAKGAYFSSTALTTVEVLAVDQTSDVAPEQDWGKSCLLLHTPPTKQLVWGTVVLSRLLKVCLKVTCKNCGCLLQGDSCGFVGCFNKTEVKTSALLTAIVADACGKAILIVKDELVQQVLQFSKAQWLGLQKLARKDGELLYLFKEKVQMSDVQTLGQEVFKMYCSVVAQNKTFILHVRCRKYAPETNTGFSHSLPVLYCVDMRCNRPTTKLSECP